MHTIASNRTPKVGDTVGAVNPSSMLSLRVHQGPTECATRQKKPICRHPPPLYDAFPT